MRAKLLFLTGGLVGYVLGARAGRKRYDQIAAAANDLWNAEPVQRRVTEVRDAALDVVGDVPGTLFKAGKKAVTKASAKKKQASTTQPAKGETAKTTPAKAVKAPAKPRSSAKNSAATAPPASSKPADDDSAAN